MDAENQRRAMRAAKALACNLWAPVLPVSEPDRHDAAAANVQDAPALGVPVVLDDPEGIEARLAGAI